MQELKNYCGTLLNLSSELLETVLGKIENSRKQHRQTIINFTFDCVLALVRDKGGFVCDTSEIMNASIGH